MLWFWPSSSEVLGEESSYFLDSYLFATVTITF